ncbi:MAG: single-stranded-DNA-specific exonuclease RecJ, partial [bacterium]
IAARFLSPSLDEIPDPFSISGMEEAVSRLAAAVALGERIAVFGDYDVDGIAGTALLAEFLEALGSPVLTALPHRQESGYGLSIEAVDAFAAQGARLIVTVDNGTRALDAAERARELGMDLIITDHHDPDQKLPPALAIVNPKLADKGSSLSNLCGCGVAFMLAAGLRRRLRETGLMREPVPNLKRMLDLVALGTIADVMPLVGLNRVLASFGLAELASGHRAGVRALLESSCTSPSELSASAIAFRLAPRINAAGRLGDPHDALALLRTSSDDEARAIASKLDAANRERQRIEERILSEAEEIIGSLPTTATGSAVVVHSDDWHPGVIGIVAAKLAERMGRPAVVISSGSRPARGSARSGGAIDLVEVFSLCADCLVRFGGHPMAAGLSIEPGRIDEFSRRFSEACSLKAGPSTAAVLAIDAIAEPSDITERIVKETLRMRPFGVGNPEPVLALSFAGIIERRIVGERHLKLKLKAKGKHFNAIGFNMAERLPPNTPAASIAFSPQFNTWNGITSIQLNIRDIVPLPS